MGVYSKLCVGNCLWKSVEHFFCFFYGFGSRTTFSTAASKKKMLIHDKISGNICVSFVHNVPEMHRWSLEASLGCGSDFFSGII